MMEFKETDIDICFDEFTKPSSRKNIFTNSINFEGVDTKMENKSTNSFKQSREQEQNLYGKNFNEKTMKSYRKMRELKIDPISHIQVDERTTFCFSYMWDSITGERLNKKDPYGPLYFDPDVLIKYFYTNRLKKIYVEQTQNQAADEYYEGYYDDGVGAGESFFIPGRGCHPQYHVFRLPLIDCYLEEDHDPQIITFGPILTLDELKEIDEKANLNVNNYKNLYRKYRPSVVKMREMYDLAISEKPKLKMDTFKLTKEQVQFEYQKMNRYAVDYLRNMRG